jgi:uncharacterized DUF497 family protein
MDLRFEWEEAKAEANLSKHGLSSQEAQTVFLDPLARIFDHELQSVDELREIIVGHSSDGRLLLVSFTERERGLVRIISARRATRRERSDYEENQYD